MSTLIVLPRRDAHLLLALSTIMLVSTWPFFWGFTTLSIAGGVLLGLALRWWHERHPVSIARTTPDRPPDINISAIHVGGDVGGLVFAAGCVGMLVVSLPPLRWFVALSLILATALAASVIRWRQEH